jgi:hypothetical protein
MMHVRIINLKEEYQMLATWWTRRGSIAPQMEILPIGVIAHDGNFDVACAFLYEDSRGVVGFVEWEATNPDCHSAMQALRGLNMLFDFWEKHWCTGPHRTLFSWVSAGRGDGRILDHRGWKTCAGDRHELMQFVVQPKEEPCQQSR